MIKVKFLKNGMGYGYSYFAGETGEVKKCEAVDKMFNDGIIEEIKEEVERLIPPKKRRRKRR